MDELQVLRGIVASFYRNSLIIESAVRNTEGRDSPAHSEIVDTIRAAQSYQKRRKE